MKNPNEIDKYIDGFPANIRLLLEQLRATIKKTAPEAEELMSYNMPAYKLKGMLVFYAACKKHIGFYPTPGPIEFFKDELTGYKTSKGAVQFPVDKPLPVRLITKIVKYRINENLTKPTLKAKKKAKKGIS